MTANTPTVTPAVYAANLVVMGSLPPVLTAADVDGVADAFGVMYAADLIDQPIIASRLDDAAQVAARRVRTIARSMPV